MRTQNPGVALSTRNAVTPPWNPFFASVMANTIATSPTGPLETKVLVPLMRQPLSARSARVRIANVSEPESGSVIACMPTKLPSVSPGR